MPEQQAPRPLNIDFSSVLAAAVHDMKNSLCLLIQSIEQIAEQLPPAQTETKEQVANLHYEAARLNTSLVQILSLYRAQLESLPITVDQCFIEDLFHDIVSSNHLYIEQRKIDITTECEPDLAWYVDNDLIYLLINDVLVNALRYGNSCIRMHAYTEDNKLVIQVEDDGPGYPPQMLAQSDAELSEFTMSQGRTGLGLFFARLIASAHTRDGQCGEISLSNGGSLGGSVFKVIIP